MVAAVVTLVALAILAYIGFQLVRFSEPPPLSVVQPPTAVTEVAQDATTYTLRGTTVAGGLVTIEAPGRDPLNLTAGGDGAWLATVDLRRGKNQFDVSAVDPKTGKPAEHPVRLLITVPFSPVVAPTLAVDSPADGASFQNGADPRDRSRHRRDDGQRRRGVPWAQAPGQAPAASAPPDAGGARSDRASRRPTTAPSPRTST